MVIPTRDRWGILDRTLAGLDEQSIQGFETLVVVDGRDQIVPDLGGPRIIVVPHGGPGAARNAGAKASDRHLLLFLGDDMVPVPDLVERHLAVHAGHPEDAVAVLGRAEWHPRVASGRIERWLEWSGTQFDYPMAATEDAGFGRFYSCNVSLKRDFFLAAGGFDEGFTYYYEDLDCGYRLGQHGMRLRYEPAARTLHLHRYDWPAIERRFGGVAAGELHMAAVHPWFTPFFAERVRAALGAGSPGRWWTWVVDLVPKRAHRARHGAEQRASSWYYERLAGAFLAGWAGARELADLQEYLGDGYEHELLVGHEHAIEIERGAAPDEATFYRTSEAYLYDLTAFAMSGTKAPYLAELRSVVQPGSRVLEYGCGIGSDGLRLADGGYDVSFADFSNPSTAYLRWRIGQRGGRNPVYDIERDTLPRDFDLAFSFDVIEHVDDPYAFLDTLEHQAGIVMVNFLEEVAGDTDLHRPLPIAALLDYADRRGLLRYRRYHGRSHLVAYRSPGAPAVKRVRSAVERTFGAHLPTRAGWHPVPSA
ncbi:MAG: glycosyltransferase [Acidimicrobiales bacterium]